MRKVFYRAAEAGAIAPGTGVRVSVGGEADCAVFRTTDDRYYATGALCSHQNEPLDCGQLEGCEVICRRHHLRYDLRTGVCTNAGGYAIQTFEVQVQDGAVLVGVWED